MPKKTKDKTQDTARREELLHRVERYTELPLLILAFLMIPLLIGPWLWKLPPQQESLFHAFDLLIWAIFAIDLIIKVAIAPHRLQYLRRHWLEVLVVVFPLVRPLRILRVFIFGSRAWVGMRRLVNVDFLLVYGIGLVIIAATIVATVERGPDVTIRTFADAVYWSIVTITTVGYGDMVPVTWAGRAVAVVLMLGGIAFFSGVTANLASFLIRRKDTDKENREIKQLLKEVAGLREEIASLHPGPASQV